MMADPSENDSSADRRAASIEEHVAACRECRAALSDSKTISSLLKTIHTPSLPGTFDCGLQTKLARARARRPARPMIAWLLACTSILRPRAALVWGAGMAAAVAAFGALLLPMHTGRQTGAGATNGSGRTTVSGSIPPMQRQPASLAPSDDAFIAACSRQHAQYSAAQTLGDPSAAALAASLDETAAGDDPDGSQVD